MPHDKIMTQMPSLLEWPTVPGKSVRSFKIKLLFYFVGLLLVIFNFYLYEQVFYELFLGNIRSTHRPYEMFVVVVGVAGSCVFLPIYACIFKARLQPFKHQILFGHIIAPVGFIMLLSFTNVSLYLDMLLRVPSSLQTADAIIIIDKGSFPFRGQYGASLYHRGLADKLVVFVRKREPYRSFLRNDLKVPDEAVIWARGRINNTYIEASTTKFLFQKYGWNAALVVADDFHMFRIMKTLEKTGVQTVYSAPVPREELILSPARLLGWEYRSQWDIPLQELDFYTRFLFRHTLTVKVFHEYAGIVFYYFKGYL